MPHKTKEGRKVYYDKNRDKINNVRKQHYILCPWAKTWQAIKSRCLNKKHGYYSRGIKNLLKTADVKYLWFRDKAFNMLKPSIDRINTKGNYTLENCRFMELSQNLRRPKSRRRTLCI